GQALTAAREHAAAAHEFWLDLRERRLRDIAAELAAQLADGTACAVCGATDHPAPARPGDGHVDRATEESAERAHREAEQARATAEQSLALVRERHATARAEAAGAEVAAGSGEAGDDPTVAELAALVDGLAA
ncbi:SMC family ATPase, partial [Streptomyces sp. SID2563]|nr:SMC family ATPase [Streptomyces sp. SID2563]